MSLEAYNKLAQELATLLGGVERVKGELDREVGQLLRTHGKGHVYDLGDGVERIVCVTKVGTHYLAPRNKWAKPSGPPALAEAPALETKAVEPLKKAKRATANGQQRVVLAEPPDPPAVLVEAETSVVRGVPVPEAVAVPQRVAAPVVEQDPLDAALAALELELD